MNTRLICILDVGKTCAKLQLVDAAGDIVWAVERNSSVLPGAPLRRLDVDGIEDWFIAALQNAPGKSRIHTIVPVAHGAAAALIDAAGRVLAVPDYEDTRVDAVRTTYAGLRDPFETTYSPLLPAGLNLGLQLFYLQCNYTELFQRAAALLLYPQYWAWRLSGVMSSEVTSLGCHSDLWQPARGKFSALAERQNWASLIPPRRQAGDVLGTVTANLSARTGLAKSCKVLCGLHDSNASYLSHCIGRPTGEPFVVISSGTWTVFMARGADLAKLQPARDMLANVDAFGEAVSTARFMGGREYQAIACDAGVPTGDAAPPNSQPSFSALNRVLDRGALALPAFAAGGPFAGQEGKLLSTQGLNPEERASLATLYLTLMSDFVIDLQGATGDIVIDGPLAGNPVYGPLLAALRPSNRVLTDMTQARATRGILHLVGQHSVADNPLKEVTPFESERLAPLTRQWRTLVAERL